MRYFFSQKIRKDNANALRYSFLKEQSKLTKLHQKKGN